MRIWSIIAIGRMGQRISFWNEVLREQAFSRLEPKAQLSVGTEPVDFQSIVVQFGLTRFRGRSGPRNFTPLYAAPEQVQGHPLNDRTDVYGLAATLEALLEPDPSASTSIPHPLRAIAAKGTHSARRHRYASVAALRADIERWCQHRPVEAYCEQLGSLGSVVGRVVRWSYIASLTIRRHRRLLGISVGIGLLLLLLLVFIQHRVEQRVESQNTVERARSTFEDLDPANAMTRAELIHRQVQAVRSTDPPSADLAQTLTDAGYLMEEIGEYQEAITFHTEAKGLVLQGANARQRATVYHNLGRLLTAENRLEEADTLLAHALRLRTTHLEAGDVDLYKTWLAVAVLRRLQGRLDESIEVS